ncbi:ABC transporter permease [Treponema sp.]
MITALFASAAPLLLAGLGGLLSDLSGSLGIFLEGFMTLGSFISWAATYWTGSAFVGISLAVLISALLGFGLSRFVHLSGANPFIAGLALNIAAAGIADALSLAFFNTKGVLSDASVPAFGPLFLAQGPFVYIAVLSLLLVAFTISKTAVGLRLRASGRDSEALTERGIDVQKYRDGAWACAAALAALGGAALSFRIGAYAPGGVAGRGWIALAAVYLGFRDARGIAIASLVFAGAELVSAQAQGTGLVPASLLLGLPSALALLLFTLSSYFRRSP